jgi:hypothetical protein
METRPCYCKGTTPHIYGSPECYEPIEQEQPRAMFSDLPRPASPFGAREYAKALNLLLQLYNVAKTLRERLVSLGRIPHGTCDCTECQTFRAVHAFIYHGEG